MPNAEQSIRPNLPELLEDASERLTKWGIPAYSTRWSPTGVVPSGMTRLPTALEVLGLVGIEEARAQTVAMNRLAEALEAQAGKAKA